MITRLSSRVEVENEASFSSYYPLAHHRRLRKAATKGNMEPHPHRSRPDLGGVLSFG